jgi:hypothetical protein
LSRLAGEKAFAATGEKRGKLLARAETELPFTLESYCAVAEDLVTADAGYSEGVGEFGPIVHGSSQLMFAQVVFERRQLDNSEPFTFPGWFD